MTNWIIRDTGLKTILSHNNDPDNEEESVARTIKELVPYLKETRHFTTLDRKVIDQMQGAKTFHQFNQALDSIYDFANEKKIWLGFMPGEN